MTPDRLALLSQSTKFLAHAAVPTYARPAASEIVHIGVGSFARAHLAVYVDELSNRGHPTTIHGVSLHSHKARDLLGPQDYLYAVSEREPGEEAELRVIGSLGSLSAGPSAVLRALRAPTTQLVTLTITEKGYDLEDSELSGPTDSVTVPGLVAEALVEWRRAHRTPPVFVSLDNLLGNGDLLRSRVIEIASARDPSLAEWIAHEVRFPNSIVDRMVPAPTDEDRDEASRQLGLLDRGAVTTERHRSWIVDEDDALRPFAEVGVQLVPDIGPFERRKLWLLNGPHSALAYCGLFAGCDTIAAAAGHDTIAPFVRRLTGDVLEVADLPTALRGSEFAHDALRRFGNRYLRHTCAQVGADGSRKLPQRYAAIVEARARAGLTNRRFAVVVALWLAAVTGVAVAGHTLPRVADPDASLLRQVAHDAVHDLASVALRKHFDRSFVGDAQVAFDDLLRDGAQVLETVP